MQYQLTAASTVLCIAASITGVAPAQPSVVDRWQAIDWNTLLEPAGQTANTARFNPNQFRLVNRGNHKLSLTESIFAEPLELPVLVNAYAATPLVNAAGDPAAVVDRLAALIDSGTRRRLVRDPIAVATQRSSHSEALRETLKRLSTPTDSEMNEQALLHAEQAISKLPDTLRQQICLLLLMIADARELLQTSFRDVPDVQALYDLLLRSGSTGLNDADTAKLLDQLQRVDLQRLTGAGSDVALASAAVANALLAHPDLLELDLAVDVPTPAGRIVINGKADNTYAPDEYLVIIDLGGNDTYFGGASTGSIRNNCSVLIDLAGDDRYVHSERALQTALADDDARRKPERSLGQAAAVCGIAVLIDCAGDDLYRCSAPSQASAQVGVAVLWDRAGNDRYDAYSFSQAYATFGVAALLDDSGDDRYDAFTFSQSCARTRGATVLIDRSGSDQYIANDTQIDQPSSQSAEHNLSMCQAAGFGRRADISDGHSMAGGIAMLIDLAGNDRYSAGVFAQGVGYWSAVGALIDLEGDDVYSGIWYAQGASAHHGIGYLADAAGNDSYRATMNMAQGAGHDWGIGMLLDGNGDDRYAAPTLSLGSANESAIGVFVDFEGRDQYELLKVGTNFGQVNRRTDPAGKEMFCMGLFVDLGGEDHYPPELAYFQNGSTWFDRLGSGRGVLPPATQPTTQPSVPDRQFGIGWDR